MMKMGKILAMVVFMVMAMSVPMMAMADVEPNDDFSSAEVIGDGEYNGTVSAYLDVIDTYKIVIPAGKAVLISGYAHNSSSITVYYYNSDKEQLGWFRTAGGSMERIFYDGKSSEDYVVFLKVTTESSLVEVEYTLNIEFRPSDIITYADEISADQKISGTIYSNSEVHWYKINIPAHKALKLACTANGDDVHVSVYKNDDNTLLSWDSGKSFEIEVKNSGDTPATAYIKVYAFSTNKVTYTLKPTFEDASDADFTSPSVSDDSPALSAPLVILGVLGVAAVVGIRRRKS